MSSSILNSDNLLFNKGRFPIIPRDNTYRLPRGSSLSISGGGSIKRRIKGGDKWYNDFHRGFTDTTRFARDVLGKIPIIGGPVKEVTGLLPGFFFGEGKRRQMQARGRVVKRAGMGRVVNRRMKGGAWYNDLWANFKKLFKMANEAAKETKIISHLLKDSKYKDTAQLLGYGKKYGRGRVVKRRVKGGAWYNDAFNLGKKVYNVAKPVHNFIKDNKIIGHISKGSKHHETIKNLGYGRRRVKGGNNSMVRASHPILYGQYKNNLPGLYLPGMGKRRVKGGNLFDDASNSWESYKTHLKNPKRVKGISERLIDGIFGGKRRVKGGSMPKPNNRKAQFAF